MIDAMWLWVCWMRCTRAFCIWRTWIYNFGWLRRYISEFVWAGMSLWVTWRASITWTRRTCFRWNWSSLFTRSTTTRPNDTWTTRWAWAGVWWRWGWSRNCKCSAFRLRKWRRSWSRRSAPEPTWPATTSTPATIWSQRESSSFSKTFSSPSISSPPQTTKSTSLCQTSTPKVSTSSSSPVSTKSIKIATASSSSLPTTTNSISSPNSNLSESPSSSTGPAQTKQSTPSSKHVRDSKWTKYCRKSFSLLPSATCNLLSPEAKLDYTTIDFLLLTNSIKVRTKPFSMQSIMSSLSSKDRLAPARPPPQWTSSNNGYKWKTSRYWRVQTVTSQLTCCTRSSKGRVWGLLE